ncbi:DUF4382 domain-containing protein [Limibacter armeniacum]|uniref:DUF4382 domain-containing protein n=1 Tax=Limibacter armeniacum TaxID=466084 RepID=UPI002FE6BECC
MKKTLLRLGVTLMAALSLMACSESETGTAKFAVRLTDAPGDFKALNINVQDVKIHVNNAEYSGWMSMEGVEKGMYNLMELTGGVDVLLAENELPAGKISQIRLVLGEGNTLTVGEKEVALKTPSAETSGLKLNLHAELTEGITYIVLLDFDVAKSIVVSGEDKYSLKPVIRAIAEATSGAVTGQLVPATDAVAYALHEGDTLASAYTDENGVFLLRGVEPGTCEVSIEPSAESHMAPVMIEGVEVVLEKVTDLETIELEEEVQ